MILNDNNQGAAELRLLTGSYYASNDFSRVMNDVIHAEDEVRMVVSDAVFDKAEKLYHSNATNEEDKKLVNMVQRCVALLAALNFFKKNDVSHEDSGRKVKVSTDDSEKIPWEWQLDRDDQVHLEAYYQAVEAVVRFLNRTRPVEWTESRQCRAAQGLLIRSGREFDKYFPIDNSERMFILMAGFVREIQISMVAPAFGREFNNLLAEDLSQEESNAHFAACKATALLTMGTALRRLPLSVIPLGVIRSYAAQNGSQASIPATVTEIRIVSDWLEADGMKWIGLMKDYRDGSSEQHQQIIPHNDPRNKFFRT